MTFTLSGSVITQSGTDTNLSGLTAIAGITTIGVNSSFIGGYNLYTTNTLRLVVNGNLSWNANTERLVFSNGAPLPTFTVSAGATVTITGTRSFFSSTVSDGEYAISFFRTSTSVAQTAAQIKSQSGLVVDGTFELIGASIYTNSTIVWDTTSVVTITNGKFFTNTTLTNNSIRIRNFCSSLTVNTILLRNLQIDFFRAPLAFNNPTWDATFVAFQFVSASDGGTNAYVEFAGFRVLASTFDGENYRAADLGIKNIPRNSLLKITHTSSQVEQSATKVFNEKNITLRSTQGAAISGSLYYKDYNNGNRTNVTYNSGIQNFVNDRTGFATSDASGIFPTQKVLCYVIKGGRVSTNAQPNYDYRSKNNSASNIFDVAFAAYGFLPTAIPIEFFGENGLPTSQSVELLSDSNRTEPNVSNVAAYPGIVVNHATQTIIITSTITAAQLYDYLCYVKTLETGIPFPVLGAAIMSTSDSVTYSCAYNITVNGGFLNAAGKFYNLGSKTFSLTSGGTTNAIVQDVNGTQATLTLTGVVTGSTIRVFSTSGTVLHESSLISGNTFTFPYVWTSDLVRDITVLKAGYRPLFLRGITFGNRGVRQPINQQSIRSVIYA